MRSAGLSASEVCRKHGISDATFYKWRSRYGGTEVSDARRLKSLEDENRRLKKLLAETMLDASALKEILGKTSDAQLAQACCDLGGPREGLLAATGLWLVGLHPKTYRYASKWTGDEELRAKLRELTSQRRRFGCRRDLALRRSVLAQRSTCPSLGDAKLGYDMIDARAAS